jgi:hypothetical protein
MKTGLSILKGALPNSVAQITGVVVTAIVTFGTDLDVTYAVPLGVFAGALAVFFVSLSEVREVPPSAYQARLARLKQITRYPAEWN